MRLAHRNVADADTGRQPTRHEAAPDRRECQGPALLRPSRLRLTTSGQRSGSSAAAAPHTPPLTDVLLVADEGALLHQRLPRRRMRLRALVRARRQSARLVMWMSGRSRRRSARTARGLAMSGRRYGSGESDPRGHSLGLDRHRGQDNVTLPDAPFRTQPRPGAAHAWRSRPPGAPGACSIVMARWSPAGVLPMPSRRSWHRVRLFTSSRP